MSVVLFTGGVRSGKSALAERQAAERGGESVLYVATGLAVDGEMSDRIRLHRARRPSAWGCVDAPLDLLADVGEYARYSAVLVDCLSTWVSNRLVQVPEELIGDKGETQKLLDHFTEWLKTIELMRTDVVIVTSEAGLGGVMMSPLGRWFQDALGEINQLAAGRADEVYAVFSGIPWRIK